MKMTVDLPEELVLQSKTVAVMRRTTLRNLVMRGLRREIESASDEPVGPIRALRGLETRIWEGTNADAYVASLRKDWE